MSSIYLSNAIFMMIILTIIFLRIRYYITWSQSKKYTMIFIGMVELYVLMDALFMKELLGKSGNLLQFKLVVFFFYLVYVIMPYVWHLFMQSYMGINRSKKQRFAEIFDRLLFVPYQHRKSILIFREFFRLTEYGIRRYTFSESHINIKWLPLTLSYFYTPIVFSIL